MKVENCPYLKDCGEKDCKLTPDNRCPALRSESKEIEVLTDYLVMRHRQREMELTKNWV